jgi:hypothetical protein
MNDNLRGSMITMRDLKFSLFLREVADAYRAHLEHQRNFVWTHGYNGDNSTSSADCAFLHLLIRHFQRRAIFEAGTYIGTSIVVMEEAARLNGGSCTTCDPIDCGCLPPSSSIRFIKGTAAEALTKLSTEGKRVDFAFFDCVPDKETLLIANNVFEPNAILTTHDYAINPKGEQTIEAISAYYNPAKYGQWFLPEPFAAPGGLQVNICTAVFIPGMIV